MPVSTLSFWMLPCTASVYLPHSVMAHFQAKRSCLIKNSAPAKRGTHTGKLETGLILELFMSHQSQRDYLPHFTVRRLRLVTPDLDSLCHSPIKQDVFKNLGLLFSMEPSLSSG